MDGGSGDRNGNRRNSVDLSLTLGSPYPSANALPNPQQYPNQGAMMIGGGPPNGMNHGNANANVNQVPYTNFMNQYHPLYNALNNNNMDGYPAVGLPIVNPNEYANFNYGEPAIERYAVINNNVDGNLRCSNANCNTTVTPLWRKGPLGPKTLCNACGIKYRKEGERKLQAAREAGASTSGN